MYYIYLNGATLNGAGLSRQLTEGVINIEVTKDEYDKYIETPNYYIYSNGEIIVNPDFEAEEKEKEQIRIANLSLTAADVERAIYKVKGMDFDDIVELASTVEGLDIKALKIELKANNFYRGNEYISQIGALLGFSESQLDNFFETGDSSKLESGE